ncbi:MAG: hypothetical protein ACRDJU_07215, partial [Actinomycetota bacterium]
VEVVEGDVRDPALLKSLVDRDEVSVFHLASMVSSACENSFDEQEADSAHATAAAGQSEPVSKE